jgi:hypothetical protein
MREQDSPDTNLVERESLGERLTTVRCCSDVLLSGLCKYPAYTLLNETNPQGNQGRPRADPS